MAEVLESEQLFTVYLDGWLKNLPQATLSQVFPHPNQSAILSVDVTNGFCKEGPLASPRVGAIVNPIVKLFEDAWQIGVRQLVLIKDTHEPAAVEFQSWAPHCIRGTMETQPVPELLALPFYKDIRIFPKNSISSTIQTELPAWLENHPEIKNIVVVGDCTDLCVYQLAMDLRIESNARQNKERRVIVPVDCVDTYDMPVDTALEAGLPPHPGAFFHTVFLYHMAMNGVEIVRSIQPD